MEAGDEDEWVFVPKSDFHTELSELPEEMLMRIFSFLPTRDLVRITSTCKTWKYVSEDDTLWASRYKAAKQSHQLEVPRSRISLAYSNGGRSWKRKYKESFHFKRGIFGSSASDEIDFRLDNDTFYSGDGGLLTGEILLNVASDSLPSNGIYLCVTGIEKVAQKKGKEERSEIRELLRFYEPIHGTTQPWLDRQQTELVYTKGSHSFPFAVPIPSQGQFNTWLTESLERKLGNFAYSVRYAVSAIFVRPWPHWNYTSTSVPLRMLPYKKETLDELLKTKLAVVPAPVVLNKDFMVGGEVQSTIWLNRTMFTFGDKISVKIAVDNTRGPADIDQVKVGVQEILRVNTGKDIGETIPRGTIPWPVSVPKGDVSVLEFDYLLDWEDIRGTSIARSNLMNQSYTFLVELNVDLLLALNPKVAIPIEFYEMPPQDEDLEDFESL